jgi:hypothetical protein
MLAQEQSPRFIGNRVSPIFWASLMATKRHFFFVLSLLRLDMTLGSGRING